MIKVLRGIFGMFGTGILIRHCQNIRVMAHGMSQIKTNEK
jgi:hypothetical protein